MRNFLENWVIKSIKPIDISCESPIILGTIEYTMDKLIVEFLPTVVAMGLLHAYLSKMSRQRMIKAQINGSEV